MSDATRITRTVDTDLDAESLWEWVTDHWSDWMVDRSDVAVAPGAEGTVVDDGVVRHVRVERVGRHELAFTWWPQDRPEQTSTVELVVVPRNAGSTLRVIETYVSASAASATAWDVRLMLLVAGSPVLV